MTSCQASVITLWHNGGPPWIELQKPDPLARFLSIFITWALLRFLQGTVAHFSLTGMFDLIVQLHTL